MNSCIQSKLLLRRRPFDATHGKLSWSTWKRTFSSNAHPDRKLHSKASSLANSLKKLLTMKGIIEPDCQAMKVVRNYPELRVVGESPEG
jgi:hypothetical protein